uniref:L-lactate dehydrogenase n=1 Tax=Globodera rostochiensis TaxID=31243 RepID=A0A914HVC5_GLORO
MTLPLRLLFFSSFILTLLLLLARPSDSANVLISPSWLNPVHRFIQRELAAELLRRNHSVTWLEYGISPHSIPLPKGVDEVFLRVQNAPKTAALRNQVGQVQLTSDDQLWREDFWHPVEKAGGWLAGLELCERVLEQPEHRKIFEKLLEKPFAVVVVDDLYNPCALLLSGIKRSLFVYWSMTGLRTESAWANQSPSPPSYIPVPGTGLTDELSFWERSYNLLAHLRELYIHQHIVLRRLDKLFQEHFPGKVPDSFTLERNASINFVNNPPIFDFARPYMPRVNFVGGLHCKNQTMTMNRNLLQFVNASSDQKGFILISGGFSIKWSKAPSEVVENLVGAIREIPDISFVWQYNGPALKDPPKNLFTAEWLPQQQLLAHSKSRAHLSHGGVNSVVESVWHGVPIIGWPLTSNGRDNLLRITARQAGLMLDRKKPPKQHFISAFHRIYIKHYKEEMLIFQDMVIDVPYTELNHSAFWVEFIIRHQEVPHARSGADDLNIFQYFLVDVILFLVGLSLLILYLLIFLLKMLFRLIILLIKLPFAAVAPLLDLCFNAASVLLFADDDIQLTLFLLQDTVLALSIVGLAIRFSSTFVFQAGLIGHFLRRFCACILVSLLYLMLSIIIHVLSFRAKWGKEGHHAWPGALTVLQRMTSVLHYYLYKRTILMLSEPKYHRKRKKPNSIKQQQAKRNKMDDSIARVLVPVAAPQYIPHNKVTIVGIGQVGMACAYSILQQNIASEITLCDVQKDKLLGEVMDLQHGVAFTRQGVVVNASLDGYSGTAGSKVCVITAGCRQREGESRLGLIERNIEIFKGIVPELVRYSPDTIILVVSNPVDVLTYVTWKLSGLPRERVFGSGTNLDSARFRSLLSERLNIAPFNCHAYVIGEHGDSSVAVWSGVNVAGVSLSPLNGQGETSKWEKEVHQKVVDSAYEIIKLKGYTSWAIGLSVAIIVQCIMANSRNVFALSINVKGVHGIEGDVFLSLPVVVGANGVNFIIKQDLKSNEMDQLHGSAAKLLEVQKSLKL